MTRWTVVLVLAEVWRIKSDKVTLGNLARPVRSSSSNTAGRWALGSVSGGTLQPRHAALLGDAARQRRGAGRPLLVVWPRPSLGIATMDEYGSLFLDGCVAVVVAGALQAASCQTGCTLEPAHHQVRSGAQWTVLCQGSLLMCVPGDAERVKRKSPPSRPKSHRRRRRRLRRQLGCHQPAGVYRYESAVSRQSICFCSPRLSSQRTAICFFTFPSDLVSICRLTEADGADLSMPDNPETGRSS